VLNCDTGRCGLIKAAMVEYLPPMGGGDGRLFVFDGDDG
jgi:hypothetical protein